MTQKELSLRLYISDKAVSKWERGLCFPDISVLIPLTEILNISLYDLLEGNKKKKDEVEEVLKETINYSNQKIKKVKIGILKKIIIIIVLIVIMLVLYYFVFEKETIVKYSNNLISVKNPIDGGIDLLVLLDNYSNGNAMLVNNLENNYDVYINITQTISTKMFKDNDKSNNLIRIENNLCVDFQTEKIKFHIPGEYNTVKINKIYYIEDDITKLVFMDASELKNYSNKVLIFENK